MNVIDDLVEAGADVMCGVAVKDGITLGTSVGSTFILTAEGEALLADAHPVKKAPTKRKAKAKAKAKAKDTEPEAESERNADAGVVSDEDDDAADAELKALLGA